MLLAIAHKQQHLVSEDFEDKKKKGGGGFELDKNENSERNAEVQQKRQKKNFSSVCQLQKTQK